MQAWTLIKLNGLMCIYSEHFYSYATRFVLWKLKGNRKWLFVFIFIKSQDISC